MIALLLAATIGGKATFLPLLLGGLGLAGLISLIVRRRIDRPLIIASAFAVAGIAYAQLVLFGGSSQGMSIEPFAIIDVAAANYMNGPPPWFLTLTFLLVLLGWTARAVGVVGILARRDRWRDPVAAMLIGMVVAALTVAFTFGQSGGGQMYFARSATPFIAVLSAWGAALLLPSGRATRRMAFVLLGFAAAGMALSTAVVVLGDPLVPTVARLGDRRAVAIALVLPYLPILGAIAALALALFLLRRRYAVLRGVSAVLVFAFVFGLGASRLIPAVRDPLRYYASHGGMVYMGSDGLGRTIAPGGVVVARWLRAHSDPDDLVATNVHCRFEFEGQCDHRHFWISAFAERHVLVESWNYTAGANARIKSFDGAWYYLPYWKPEVLADNDRVFSDPTPANVRRLRERYGVRWLFVDERYETPAPGLGAVARERFRSGRSVLYDIGG
jgi:hypothetical protein